jgi:signal peptidase I
MQSISSTSPFYNGQVKTKSSSLTVDVLQSVIIAVFVCTIIYLFIATPNQVSGQSMQPSFEDGQLLLTNKVIQWLGDTDLGPKLGLNYQRGDVIVFQRPGERDFIKRIIGMPDEKISIKNGNVYINGEQLVEEYIPSEVRTNGGTFLQTGDEFTIPANHYFVMGDNRSNSEDSRYTEIGFVSRDWMKGKVVMRYWPPTTFGIIGTGVTTLEQ